MSFEMGGKTGVKWESMSRTIRDGSRRGGIGGTVGIFHNPNPEAASFRGHRAYF